ncbi:MAG: hypothetical protein ABIT16_10035 [Croceibacterium sp.]
MADSPAPARPEPVEGAPFTPVPRQCARHDGWTPERQRGFIEALADTGSVRHAAGSVGMAPEGAYQLRRQPGAEEFAAAWRAALDKGVERIEDVAMDRALNGVEVPVFSYGKLVGTRTKYNDRLLMFMLRNRAPERFAEGGARGLSAIDRHTLARMKQEWRKEWERERAAKTYQEEDALLASIDAKLDKMAQRRRDNMSDATRAAFEEYRRLAALDAENGYRHLYDRAVAANAAREAEHQRNGTVEIEEPPEWFKQMQGQPDEEAKPQLPASHRIITLKDDGI